MTSRHRAGVGWAAMGLAVLLWPTNAYSYSVLTHEAIIDSTWDSAIKPLLLKRFPSATADELMAAPTPTEDASFRTWDIIRLGVLCSAI